MRQQMHTEQTPSGNTHILLLPSDQMFIQMCRVSTPPSNHSCSWEELTPSRCPGGQSTLHPPPDAVPVLRRPKQPRQDDTQPPRLQTLGQKHAMSFRTLGFGEKMGGHRVCPPKKKSICEAHSSAERAGGKLRQDPG